MANPAEASVLRTRVRRRRAARAGVAGIAALAVMSTSGWLIQQALGQENDAPPAEETTAAEEPTSKTPTTPDESTTSTAAEETPVSEPLPEFGELVGATMDLSSFIPGSDVDQVCPTDGVELQDGTTGEYMRDTGTVALLEVVHTPLSEGGEDRAVAFLGCRFGEAAAYQAVTLAEGENGDWIVDQQLIHSQMNADRPYDIMADPEYGVLVAVAEIYACCDTDPDELDYWIERIRLDDAGDVDSERLEESDVAGLTNITDLSLTLTVTTTGEEGVWTVSASVRNEGDRTSAPFDLTSCATIDTIEWPSEIEHCNSDTEWVETFDALEPDAEWEEDWEVTVAPSAEWQNQVFIRMSIEPNLLADGIARDQDGDDNSVYYEFTP
jgi:hypothetical protein